MVRALLVTRPRSPYSTLTHSSQAHHVTAQSSELVAVSESKSKWMPRPSLLAPPLCSLPPYSSPSLKPTKWNTPNPFPPFLGKTPTSNTLETAENQLPWKVSPVTVRVDRK